MNPLSELIDLHFLLLLSDSLVGVAAGNVISPAPVAPSLCFKLRSVTLAAFWRWVLFLVALFGAPWQLHLWLVLALSPSFWSRKVWRSDTKTL